MRYKFERDLARLIASVFSGPLRMNCPISIYFGQEDTLGSFGIWLGLLAGLTTAAILLYIRFNYLTKKLIHAEHGIT